MNARLMGRQDAHDYLAEHRLWPTMGAAERRIRDWDAVRSLNQAVIIAGTFAGSEIDAQVSAYMAGVHDALRSSAG